MKEVTSRYALALFSLKKESNHIDETQVEIKELKKVFEENPDFAMLLDSSYKSLEEKLAIVDQTLIGVDEDIINLIKIVVKNHRAKYLVEIFADFNSIVNEYRGVKEGLVYSTNKLTSDQLDRLNKTISEVEKQPVELKNIIDPSLIGGVKVVINDHIYDGSVKHHINEMKLSLLK